MLRRLMALPWIHPAYDVLVAFLVACVAWQYEESADRAVGSAMALVLLFRRSRPMTVMGAVTGLTVVQSFIATDISGYDAAVLVAMVSVVTHTRTMWHARSPRCRNALVAPLRGHPGALRSHAPRPAP